MQLQILNPGCKTEQTHTHTKWVGRFQEIEGHTLTEFSVCFQEKTHTLSELSHLQQQQTDVTLLQDNPVEPMNKKQNSGP